MKHPGARIVLIAALATFATLGALTVRAFAADEPTPAPLRDPYVPSASRASAPMPETRGEALRAQVERKLRADFDAADTERKGSITRDQARAARLAVVHDNLDAIDGARKGRITFEDYKRFLRARGARTL